MGIRHSVASHPVQISRTTTNASENGGQPAEHTTMLPVTPNVTPEPTSLGVETMTHSPHSPRMPTESDEAENAGPSTGVPFASVVAGKTAECFETRPQENLVTVMAQTPCADFRHHVRTSGDGAAWGLVICVVLWRTLHILFSRGSADTQ